MSDHYGLPDLRQFISGRTHLRTNPLLQEPLSIHCSLGSSAAPLPNSYEHVIAGDVFSRGFAQFPLHDYSSSVIPTNTTTATTASDAFCSIEAAEKGWLGFDAGNNRWPRQETLSLLEIRSRLDSKFRETNQKGPLWNEVSRIMGEEYGYQRSGKKCKEKFENLYKYYKKTKEGKAGRQDGKHYRFFRQLEAICGETSSTHAATSSETLTHNHGRNINIAPFNQTPSITINQDSDALHNLKCSESLSFSNSSEFETSSSENNDEDLSAIAYMMKQSRNEKQKGLDQRQIQGRGRRSWKAKVEELVDTHMRKLIETQDAWMEKMFSVIEHREQEMASKEEERKKRESIRFDREVHELWAKERAWVEARDAALMEVVKKHIGKGSLEALPLAEPLVGEEPQINENKSHKKYPSEAGDHGNNRWTELEISNLIQLKTGFELRFQESGYLENGVWDEIAAKMACLGFDRSANECKQIWDEISISLSKTRPLSVGLQLTDNDLSHSSSNAAGTRGYV